MPRRCCVPNCKGNYDTTLKGNNYISVFKFPKDEQLRKKWMAAIPHKNWTLTKYSAVCSLHFAETDIQRYQNIPSPNGVLENVLFRCPRLMENAIPSIFSNSPSKRVLPQRKDPIERRERIIENHENLVREFIDSNLISGFLNLINNYKEKLVISNHWSIKIIIRII
ncbi:THAP domain-containing protein 1 A-like [Lasioglossum baleicum]|uniref:THAP domain-containing protein 1 A-like n=1 Tax=Lasioglossum baleicum TaxID=434251 RepID=UPI003FCE1E56